MPIERAEADGGPSKAELGLTAHQAFPPVVRRSEVEFESWKSPSSMAVIWGLSERASGGDFQSRRN